LFLTLALFLSPARLRADTEKVFTELGKLSPAERQQRLIEGAKKEGEVMLYTSSGLEKVRVLTKLFAKKYPFIKVRSVRRGGSQLFNVALLEFKGQNI
jgi:hypothetical protein